VTVACVLGAENSTDEFSGGTNRLREDIQANAPPALIRMVAAVSLSRFWPCSEADIVWSGEQQLLAQCGGVHEVPLHSHGPDLYPELADYWLPTLPPLLAYPAIT
jgi:hypothetical protein